MNMCGRSWLAAAVVAASLGCTAADQRGGERPNILLIVADDMGYSDAGAYGSECRESRIHDNGSLSSNSIFS